MSARVCCATVGSMIVEVVIALVVLVLALVAARVSRRRPRTNLPTVVEDDAALEARIYRQLYAEHLGCAERLPSAHAPSPEVAEHRPEVAKHRRPEAEEQRPSVRAA